MTIEKDPSLKSRNEETPVRVASAETGTIKAEMMERVKGSLRRALDLGEHEFYKEFDVADKSTGGAAIEAEFERQISTIEANRDLITYEALQGRSNALVSPLKLARSTDKRLSSLGIDLINKRVEELVAGGEMKSLMDDELDVVARKGDEHQRERALGYIAKRIDAYKPGERGPKMPMQLVETMIAYGSGEQAKKYMQQFTEAWNASDFDQDEGVYIRAAYNLTQGEDFFLRKNPISSSRLSREPDRIESFLSRTRASKTKEDPQFQVARARGLELVANRYPQLGEHTGELVDAWRASGGNLADAAQAWNQNITAFDTLEERQPGSTTTLMENFNIKTFGRYPAEVLLAQLDEIDDQSRYMAIFIAEHDGNGVFLGDQGSYKNLYDQFREAHKKGGEKINMRIFEVASKRDIARILLTLKRKYTHKIAAGMVGGHGVKDPDDPQSGEGAAIALGGIWGSECIAVSNLAGQGVERSLGEEFWEPNAPRIFETCSAGSEGGIAQRISKQYLPNNEITASPHPIKSWRYNVALSTSGALSFESAHTAEEVEARESSARGIYKAGEMSKE